VKIGFCWAGSPSYHRDFARSIPLAQWWPLLRLPGTEWVALLTGALREELAGAPPHIATPDLPDWSETVRIARTCDLIVTVDTALAHVAGSARLPTWVLLAYPADWRWLEDRTDSPWYPTVRLYRQKKPGGDWWEVLDRVHQDLVALTERTAA
jgi:ADP-heptose:LPS heptosyltransferase